MIFVTGPMYAGKKEFICSSLNWSEEELRRYAVWDVQELALQAEDLEECARTLMSRRVVIASEVGAGIVPADPEERLFREKAGRLSCLLAQRAELVIRVCCGLPQVLKGNMSQLRALAVDRDGINQNGPDQTGLDRKGIDPNDPDRNDIDWNDRNRIAIDRRQNDE